MPSHNDQVAADMFRAVDAGGPQGVRRLDGPDSGRRGHAWRCWPGRGRPQKPSGGRSAGWGCWAPNFGPVVFDGLFLQLPIYSVDALRCAYATVLIREANYSQADELLNRAGQALGSF